MHMEIWRNGYRNCLENSPPLKGVGVQVSLSPPIGRSLYVADYHTVYYSISLFTTLYFYSTENKARNTEC